MEYLVLFIIFGLFFLLLSLLFIKIPGIEPEKVPEDLMKGPQNRRRIRRKV